MKTLLKINITILVALLLATGVLPARAVAQSENIAREVEKLIPQIQKTPDKFSDADSRQMSSSLARVGRLEAALRIANSIPANDPRLPPNDWSPSQHDEVWRFSSRRFALQGKIAEATRSASKIKGEYSRADAFLGIARAHLRAKNTAAALGVLRKAEPVIRVSKSSQAMAYLAWLFIQAGDVRSARALFTLASGVKNPNPQYESTLGDHGKQSIALYQAKAGWNEDALKTVGDNISNLPPLKSVFIAQRNWKALHGLAAKLPSIEAVNFLIDLATIQKSSRLIAEAKVTLALAKLRFNNIEKTQKHSPDGIYIQMLFSLLEIATGEANKGRAHFSELSKLPNFNADHEFTFYYFLVAPSGVFKVSQSPRQQAKDENAALIAVAKLKDGQSNAFPLIEIALARQARGDTGAMRKTLNLARKEIQSNLTKPLKEEKDRDFLRFVAAGYLMQIARIEAKSAAIADSRSTLTKAMSTMRGESKVRIARLLLHHQFNIQAGDLLQQFVATSNMRTNANRSDMEEVPSIAALYALQSGSAASLIRVSKIKDVAVRANALSMILIALNPLPVEERELILRGNKATGAQVSSQFSLPGYHVSQNFNEFE